MVLSLKSWIMQLQKHNCATIVLHCPPKSQPKRHLWSLCFLQLDAKAQETWNKTAKLKSSRNAKMKFSTLLSTLHKESKFSNSVMKITWLKEFTYLYMFPFQCSKLSMYKNHTNAAEEKSYYTTWARWSKAQSTVISHINIIDRCPSYDVLKMILHFWDLPHKNL